MVKAVLPDDRTGATTLLPTRARAVPPDPVRAGHHAGAGPARRHPGHQDELVAAVIPPPPVDAGAPTAAALGEAPPTAEVHEQERVTLIGRLGQNPRVRTTPKGTLIAQFPLGVKDETDLTKTTWHQVLAFRTLAERARDTLKQGDAVEVIGYRHTREIPGRNGPRTVEEIYATVLKPRS